MARSKSVLTNIARTARKIERSFNKYAQAHEAAKQNAEKARQKRIRQLQTQQILEERQQILEERQQRTISKDEVKRLKAEIKEQKQRYVEARNEEVDSMNAELQAELEELEGLLQATLGVDDYIDLNTLKKRYQPETFQIPVTLNMKIEKPLKPIYPVLSFVQSLVPGAKSKHEATVEAITADYQKKVAKYKKLVKDRDERIEYLRKRHQIVQEKNKSEIEEENRTIDDWIKSLSEGEPESVVDYFALVLESSVYPDSFPQHTKLAYVPESRQLVMEYDLPSIEAMPTTKQYKYVKSRDEITSTNLPNTQVKKLYNSVIAQISVRTIHEIFEADRLNNVETIVFNGHVNTINPATGQAEKPCLVTVRTTKDVFENLNLAQVEPIACLKGLNASVSSKPEELAPVRPVVEFNMVDARFVEETDVISELDQRQNLMDLSPYEFENLITNLFQKMGLEAKQTQSSRDGGVDCVAFDPRPIFGGKVVIQAKRYKNTVGVSAVRDLFGTMQNEGASKGILVTTSGYGKAAFEFAEGKPIELLDGSNLLYLLSEHADLEAKIVMPVD